MTQPLFLERFSATADLHGLRPAVVGPDLPAWTYGELKRRAAHLGEHLRDRGAGPGNVVGLLLDKSPEYVAALLGVLYAGAAFLPLDPALPQERLAFLAGDAGLRLFVTTARLRDRLGAGVGIMEVADGVPAGPAIWAPTRVSAAGPAYVIYTSGTTGRPKGVVLPHRGIVSLLDAQIAAFGMGPASRSLLYLSTSFDASISDIGTALLSGASLHIDDRARRSPAELIDVLSIRRITHLDLPPALLRVLDPARMPAALETLIIGGEVCPPVEVRRWAARLRVVNVYGPTEATICASLCRCDAASWDRPLIGQPVPGASLHVLDGQLAPAAAGTPAELYLGGLGLALGYLNRPELDAAKFVTVAGERLYRTGDRVVRHGSGDIEFLGRVDRQIKLRGLLIEPEEIEARLLLHPAVMQAAVWVRRRGQGQSLVASVVARDPAPSPPALREHLAQVLPGWMLPQRFEVLDEMPLTAAGKPDLPALAQGLARARRQRALETTQSVEVLLREIWRSVLDLDEIGVNEDFFALGGDSFAVLEVMAAAESAGLPLSPALLMRQPTLAGLAARLREEDGEGSLSEASVGAMSAAALRDDVGWFGVMASGEAEDVPRRVLLTGATGFLGSHVLDALLKRTRATLSCLVRARGEYEAKERVFAALSANGARLSQQDCDRIEVVCGDLEKPDLGLSTASWAGLSTSIDTIYHCAAGVNLVQPYAALRAANVGGTQHILRLAATGRRKRLHYVSTLSVFVATDRNHGPLHEDDDLSATRWVYGGYAQSKWAAEHLLRASGYGPISYYRLGLITGDTKTGVCPDSDLLSLFCHGIAKLGCVPPVADLPGLAPSLKIDITPVDFAAAALVYLSLHAPSSPVQQNPTYHLANPRSLPLEDLIEAMRTFGLRIDEVPPATWRSRLATAAVGAEVSAAGLALCRCLPDGIQGSPFARLRTLDLFQASGVEFRMDRATAGLADSGLSCPPPDQGLLHTYLRHLFPTAGQRLASPLAPPLASPLASPLAKVEKTAS